VRDLTSAVNFILKRQNLSQLNIFGMSWGGSVTGAFTSRNNDKVNKLIVLAPQWLSTRPIPIDTGEVLGAYRLIPSGTRKNGGLVPLLKKKGLTSFPMDGLRNGLTKRWRQTHGVNLKRRKK
jgi:pimeloyl-ACP methyl ester carboxylesterase